MEEDSLVSPVSFLKAKPKIAMLKQRWRVVRNGCFTPSPRQPLIRDRVEELGNDFVDEASSLPLVYLHHTVPIVGYFVELKRFAEVHQAQHVLSKARPAEA
jgi:hypothetical protein